MASPVTNTDDYDMDVQSDGGGNFSGTIRFCYHVNSNDKNTRSVYRFPTTGVLSTDTVTLVEFLPYVNSTFNVITGLYVGAYNGDGQADPSVDSAATMFSRADTSADNYGGALTTFLTTGAKTIDLGATAVTDVQACLSAGTKFTLALRLVDETDGVGDPEVTIRSLGYGTAGERPRIRITFTTGGATALQDTIGCGVVPFPR